MGQIPMHRLTLHLLRFSTLILGFMKREIISAEQVIIEQTEDHGLFLTSAAPDGQWSHSLFAPVSSWTRKDLSKRETFVNSQQHEGLPRISVSSVNGITLQKCGVVNYQLDPPAASVRLLINNTSTSPPAVAFDLLLSDNVTGLLIQGSSGNQTGNGAQTFSRAFLQAGRSFLVSYTAFLDPEGSHTAMFLSLPAHLTCKMRSQNTTQFYSLLASFTVRAEAKSKISPHHGIHFAGFIITFVGSLLLTCIAFFMIHRNRKAKGMFPSENLGNRYKADHNQKLECSQVNSTDTINEDFIMNDKMIGILTYEEIENMLQALEDMETADLTQADSYLEACRMHICKDAIVILLRNMAVGDSVSVHDKEGLSDAIKKQFHNMEDRLEEEHERKMVALAAECSLEARKAMDMQYQREMAAKEEVAELMNHASEMSVAECRVLLDKLHELEQNQMRRLLMAKEEGEFAKAYRELAVSRRTELHNSFFKQLKEVVLARGIDLEAARAIMEEYSKMQEEIEGLMDFMQATKKYHLNKRFACRKYLVYSVQLCENKARSLLNTVATQILTLINTTERAGHVTENRAGILLERAQTEVLSVKQKLERTLRQEKKKLRQKLIARRKQQMSQKQKEQRKELATLEDTFSVTQDVGSYLKHWKTLFTSQSLEFEELVEKLDSVATEELKALKFTLTKKATEELRRVQNVVIMQELLKFNAPRLHLQQILEEHNKDIALRSQQFENEEYIKNAEAKDSLESSARKLNEECERNMKDQKNLRTWEQLLFIKLQCLPLSLSDEELLQMKQEFQCIFSQMDSNLTLPKIQGRLMLQTYQSEWRKAELLKLDQNLSMNDATKQSMMKTQCPEDKKTDVQKKSIEDKIHIYEEAITDNDIKKVRGELLLDRVHQLKARENKLGEYIASLQFHKTIKKSNALEVHMAVINLQALLLKELCSSGIKSEYAQLAEAHVWETEELGKKLKLELSQKELTQHHQHLKKMRTWTVDDLVSFSEAGEAVPRTMSVVLRQALNTCKRMIDLQRERLREEELDLALTGHLQENIEMDMFLTFHSQDLRLAAHLTRQAMVPTRTLHRLLNLLLPSGSKLELLSVLDSVNYKFADGVTETDLNGEEADSCIKRMHQDSWLAVENRLRQALISQFSEKASPASKKQRSIFKKQHLRPVKRVSFTYIESLSNLSSVGPYGYYETSTDAAAEEIHLTDTGEKVFVFIPKNPTISSLPPKKKKKRNFLNFKKSKVMHLDTEG